MKYYETLLIHDAYNTIFEYISETDNLCSCDKLSLLFNKNITFLRK